MAARRSSSNCPRDRRYEPVPRFFGALAGDEDVGGTVQETQAIARARASDESAPSGVHETSSRRA
jgi:hypothetical protein